MSITDFTYDSYEKLIADLRSNGYNFTTYHEYESIMNPCILRHDIDYSLEKAAFFAELENKLNIKSTYFILLTSEFYNLYSKKSRELLFRIKECNHEIGLHFDEKVYRVLSQEHLTELIISETETLSGIIKQEIKSVSMHCPSKEFLSSDFSMPGIKNSYSNEFFIGAFKYFSDSTMFWRENVQSAITGRQFKKLQILTHPFWYTDNIENISSKLKNFIKNACEERYYAIKDDLKELEEFVKPNEVL